MINEHGYLKFLDKVRREGYLRQDRTGVGCKSYFGGQLQFDLRDGFPLLTTKRMSIKSVAGELIWFLSGSTDVADLNKLGVTIWDEWATPEKCAKFGRPPGHLGPTYGFQWNNFGHIETWGKMYVRQGINQIQRVIESLRRDPDSRRHVVSAWDPHSIDQVELPPCHVMFQFVVLNNELNCHMYQRSADLFLGVPYNIASYALLTHMIAQQVNLKPTKLAISFGDAHIYLNHLDQVDEQLLRKPYDPPELKLNKRDHIRDYTLDDIKLDSYQHYPPITAPVAI